MPEYCEHPKWPPVLEDAAQIAAHVEQCSPDYVDEEFVEEYFFDCRAVLRKVEITSLKEGGADVNVASDAKASRYAALPLEGAPPLVVMDGVVEDGNHRLRDAISRGASHILCYVVEPLPAPDNTLINSRSTAGFKL